MIWLNFYIFSDTGCPTKHNSWWTVLNVVFHILYKLLKTFWSLFLQKICYSNLFYFEINFTIIWLPCDIFSYSFWQIINKLWKTTIHQLSWYMGHPVPTNRVPWILSVPCFKSWRLNFKDYLYFPRDLLTVIFSILPSTFHTGLFSLLLIPIPTLLYLAHAPQLV